LLEKFFASVGPQAQMIGLYRKSNYRSSPLTDKRALAAWATRIIQKANEIVGVKKFKDGTVTFEFMQEVAKLSAKEDGVLLAIKYLEEQGIKVVVEPHFAKTHLDGAVILVDKNNPIIGITLRHDRLDNFWFTLMHELAHIALHYNQDVSLFYDEIEGVEAGVDEKEIEADGLAQEALLPKAKWEVSPARIIPSSMAANNLARELGVHVAIIAGQIRYRGNKYVYLNKIINDAKVRFYFPLEKWNN
jgi:HTH-type transcriptional regulator/antitoxin HigA